MNSPEDSYWSIETCGWVRYPVRTVEVPDPRPADGFNEVRPSAALDSSEVTA